MMSSCVAVCCSVLQCVAVVLQCVPMCCSVSQYLAGRGNHAVHDMSS